MINELIANKRKRAFTLAEALITLVIIGVIAALTIPAILVNTEQNEYKTALRKAVSSLNSVIELNIALDGYGPIETTSMQTATADDSLFTMFRRRMNVISTSLTYQGGSAGNAAFFTADGLRYEFPASASSPKNGSATSSAFSAFATNNSGCGKPDDGTGTGTPIDDNGVEQTKPCLIIVDVNGDRKPNPRKNGQTLGYKVPKPSGNTARVKVLDVFPVMITNTSAVPYGVVAQRAMFQHD